MEIDDDIIYPIKPKQQYLVHNNKTNATEIMEWRGTSFRDKKNEMYFLGTVVPLRDAEEQEKIKVPEKRYKS